MISRLLKELYGFIIVLTNLEQFSGSEICVFEVDSVIFFCYCDRKFPLSVSLVHLVK